jgi:hypothetical protein
MTRSSPALCQRTVSGHDLTIKRELYRQWGGPYVIVDRATDPFTMQVEGELPEWATVLFD